MPFVVLVTRAADRQLARLPQPMRRRVEAGLHQLKEDPRRSRPGADIKMLRGDVGQYRLRVGDYRALYVVEGQTVWVTGVVHRSHAYD